MSPPGGTGTRAPHTLFISDLHLAADTPAANETLLRFLRSTARTADALYVLGDLFDYWIGDDTLKQPFEGKIAGAFRELVDSGVPVYFMHGNRDFLIGRRFARASGMKLLRDPTLIDLYGSATLLMHGDTLCTGDVDYLKFRKYARNPVAQWLFLRKSLAKRLQIAHDLRGKSEHAKSGKDMAIMDVAPKAVEDELRAHKYPRLIHGHTHRPARHEHTVDGRVCERWVLADWYEHGSYLECDARGCRPQPMP
ncbi:MAG TPA: UDP-2,3-diacylglucosamine diphosphatase [Burkholderiales bacterium]|nr:UDP-2,3-diacylglucosamine diphosphatase [Burkholderiales bacterium]